MCPCLLCNARPSKTRGALQRSVAGKSSNNGWRRFAPFRVYSKLAKLHYAELWWYDELNDHSFPHWIAIGSTLRCADILAGGRWRAKILHLESPVQMTQHFHVPFATSRITYFLAQLKSNLSSGSTNSFLVLLVLWPFILGHACFRNSLQKNKSWIIIATLQLEL